MACEGIFGLLHTSEGHWPPWPPHLTLNFWSHLARSVFTSYRFPVGASSEDQDRTKRAKAPLGTRSSQQEEAGTNVRPTKPLATWRLLYITYRCLRCRGYSWSAELLTLTSGGRGRCSWCPPQAHRENKRASRSPGFDPTVAGASTATVVL